MTASKNHGESILRREAIGFSLIILLTWVAEIVDLPHLLYGEPAEFLWRRVATRTLVFAAIWLWVHLTTWHLLQRLHHLEEFLRMCSWCRRIDHEGEWLTMEQFFDSKFDTETSHGMCPDCAQKQFGQHRATRVKKSG